MSLFANVVSPGRDGIQMVVSNEGLDHYPRCLIEMIFSDGGDDLMPLATPAPTRDSSKHHRETRQQGEPLGRKTDDWPGRRVSLHGVLLPHNINIVNSQHEVDRERT
jgi:hypothetical protein